MNGSLATLRRHSTRVLLRDSFPFGDSGRVGSAGPVAHLEFRAPLEAVHYLRFWKLDPAAMASLRRALGRYRPGPVARLSNDEVIDVLAVHLARGELALVTESEILRPSTAGVAVSAASSAASSSAAPRRVLSPAETPPAPLLPKLEEVQIEGARVLPEVLQTLEQLELTMSEIDLATVSLEPAPSGVPPIGAALQNASGSITTTLDGL